MRFEFNDGIMREHYAPPEVFESMSYRGGWRPLGLTEPYEEGDRIFYLKETSPGAWYECDWFDINWRHMQIDESIIDGATPLHRIGCWPNPAGCWVYRKDKYGSYAPWNTTKNISRYVIPMNKFHSSPLPLP